MNTVKIPPRSPDVQKRVRELRDVAKEAAGLTEVAIKRSHSLSTRPPESSDLRKAHDLSARLYGLRIEVPQAEREDNSRRGYELIADDDYKALSNAAIVAWAKSLEPVVALALVHRTTGADGVTLPSSAWLPKSLSDQLLDLKNWVQRTGVDLALLPRTVREWCEQTHE